MFDDNRLERLEQRIEQLTQVIIEQEKTIQSQHQTICNFQNDLLLKVQKDMIMEMIGFADQLQLTLDTCGQSGDFDALYSQVEELYKWVNSSLNVAAVRRFVSDDGDKLDPRRQEVTERIATDDPTLDGTIVSQLPGYCWALPWLIMHNKAEIEAYAQQNQMPQKFEFVLRPEQVLARRFRGTRQATPPPFVPAPKAADPDDDLDIKPLDSMY